MGISFQLLLTKIVNFILATEIRSENATVNGVSVAVKRVYDGGIAKMYFDKGTPDWLINILYPVISVGKSFVVPIFIVLGLGGVALIISISVKYAKAENADEKDHAKNRLIWACIGVLIMIIALIIVIIFINKSFEITHWIFKSSTPDTNITKQQTTSSSGVVV